MKLIELAQELDVSAEAIKQFIQDFDLELANCISTNFEVKEDFEKFARENIDFLRRYEKDLDKAKTPGQIAEKINQPQEKVEEAMKEINPNIFDNGFFKSSVSSYGIDNKLGGNYQFVYNYFGNITSLQKRDFIGYRDLFFYISSVLEPFLNPQQIKDWGINKPAGVILYGPPGSGKIFWAKKIAEIIGYEFREVKKHYLGTSFVDGSKTHFNDFLVTAMKQDKVLLFLDDFDSIMMARKPENNVAACNLETQEVILHHISKFEQENVLMVGSATTVSEIDEEILAPGRFDVLIPVFPPNKAERSEIILYSMTRNLDKSSLLYKILKNNKADKIPFWDEVSSKMKVFSNTMLIDFTQSLKKRIKYLYYKTKNENLKIDKNVLDGALRDAAGKLTEEYLDQIAMFLKDVIINSSDQFQYRIQSLKTELDAYRVVEEPRRAIGFQHNDEQKDE
ncbi:MULTISPECIES: AAA family ATPase [Chryseobacterium]|uniref:Transitional endoplasmic reticulum ATPase n=1 Tax=Chryseobacterium camelliae TaxID=1265445 RepID=A0ABU0TEE4_9FLAO|nr:MULTISPECIES: ATP-binding protein [Chryseobacterium]MDT3406758.1 transitional endoplasmic reticulum ATPase [Pseudacidovorax intermedius]MDQ1095445.1 transitional endoplasmic reticulum ATPase [Chryseobacterium camelliae]MDQ1099385.1 transitional endoplasmic reticulum ATPase [Chryseobacterium sp. SORGH_AS_1048]MDR6086731.1 transitional endoplasmic reticulum ATPase [Chryseobacterium sp. SORGH_AS_0909]MDR6131103.1 transitional endoplasmic reticulum ATPase [Chryseobacterium sp. SORGH_AS_1175]